MRRNQGTAKEWCVRRNPLGRRSWAYTEALTSGYMMADEVHSSKFHASRGGVLVACPELDWFSDPDNRRWTKYFSNFPTRQGLNFLGWRIMLRFLLWGVQWPAENPGFAGCNKQGHRPKPPHPRPLARSPASRPLARRRARSSSGASPSCSSAAPSRFESGGSAAGGFGEDQTAAAEEGGHDDDDSAARREGHPR